jgi:hypothetical protein
LLSSSIENVVPGVTRRGVVVVADVVVVDVVVDDVAGTTREAALVEPPAGDAGGRAMFAE